MAANYRPISLTSIVCRTIEQMIAAELRAFMNTENITIDEQHDFVPKRSTVLNLYVSEQLDRQLRQTPTDVVYLDYKELLIGTLLKGL